MPLMHATDRVWTRERTTALISAISIALCAGTNYIFSAYAPQLASRLHISHTQLNLIGLTANLGVYTSGPVWGRLVDRKGPRLLFVCAFFMLLSGYSGIRYFYNAGDPGGNGPSIIGLAVLMACGFMTGAGSNAGFACSVNAATLSFPDRLRSTTTGLVLSGFGLSAFLFSSLSHLFYPGDTSGLLLFLSFGTSLPMILGFFLVHPIPMPSTRPLETSRSLDTLDRDDAVEEARVGLLQDVDAADGAQLLISPPATKSLEQGVDIHGRTLFTGASFWILFINMTLLSGTGLMYINNVGSVVQALLMQGNAPYDDAVSSMWQAAQVSTISIFNCLGRVAIGFTADFVKTRLSRPRAYCLTLIAIFLFLSQLVGYSVEDVQHLGLASAFLGFGYGSLFGIYPSLIAEWFGMPHFSENWGVVHVSPIIGANVFSLIFGLILDAHAPSADIEPSDMNLRAVTRGGLPSKTNCLAGRECYAESLKLTMLACSVAFGLSVWAGIRDRRQQLLRSTAAV